MADDNNAKKSNLTIEITPEDRLLTYSPSRPDQPEHFVITDYCTHYDELSKIPGPDPRVLQETKSSFLKSIFFQLFSVNPLHWVFLVFVGILAVFTGVFVDTFSGLLNKVRVNSVAYLPPGINLVFFLAWGLFFCYIAGSVGLWFTSDAEGSGVPEIRSIMGGSPIYRFISMRTYVGRVIGLISAIAAGLSVGKEGPFINIAACVANALSRVPMFRSIQQSETAKKQMLTAAAAAGVVATFGTSIGGVIFSVEVTSTFFTVATLAKAFFCAMWGVFTFKLLSLLWIVDLYPKTNYSEVPFWGNYEYFMYAIAGALSGCFAALFIMLFAKINIIRNKLKWPYVSNRWYYLFTVSIVVSICCFDMDFFHVSEKQILADLFSEKNVELTKNYWSDPYPLFNVGFYTFLKLLFTILSITSNIPAGVFAPSVFLGAAFGRFLGNFLNLFFPVRYIGLYAVIGASAFTATVTHTISVAVILLELNGQLVHILPVLVGTLAGFIVGTSLSMSIFDTVIMLKGLPFLPAIRRPERYVQTAGDIMNKNFLFLAKDSTIKDLLRCIKMKGVDRKAIPIAESKENKTLLYNVSIKDLKKYYEEKVKALPKEVTKLAEIIVQLKEKKATELMKNIASPRAERDRGNRRQAKEFLKHKIDFQEIGRYSDMSPLTVYENTPLAKVHFLFTMLSPHQLYVIDRGYITGVITVNDFLRKAKIGS